MSSNIERLINTFEEYYNRKHNHKEATTLLESLCYACHVQPNFPKYRNYNDVAAWYEAIVNWLVKVGILQ